ncbi:MAG: DUF2802 domain-containing protein [Methylobacter sp.]
MNNSLMAVLIAEGVIIIAMIGVLAWLIQSQLKLRRDVQVLSDMVNSHSNDIAGLCSAALTIDSRIAEVDNRIEVADGYIDDLAAKIADVEQHDQSSHPYSGDIRKVRSGASVDELMKNSGLSHDEAALLIRLHGAKKQV